MLHHLSTMQILDLWTDLEEAFNNTHSFGGDVAEIYVYRAMARSPSTEAYVRRGHRDPGMFDEDIRAEFFNARAAMLALFRLFEQKRDCKVQVERRLGDRNEFVELGEWVAEERNEHRFHVKVTPSAKQLEALQRGRERRT